MCVCVCALQTEEGALLREQVSGLDQELGSEKARAAELQRALEQSQETLASVQSLCYGKESEASALRQDLQVRVLTREVNDASVATGRHY